MGDHPITPPPELVKKWVAMLEYCEDIDVFTDVVRWGADTELEKCCEWLEQNCGRWELPAALRAARRPKPPSLKEQALQALRHLEKGAEPQMDATEAAYTIRRALEQLDD